MPQSSSSSKAMFAYPWLISVSLRSWKNSSFLSLCWSNLLSPREEGQVFQTKVGHLVPSDLFEAVLGGLLLLLSCRLLDLLGVARCCRAAKLLTLHAEIWSTKVCPCLDFKLLLVWKVPILSLPCFSLAPIQCCLGMSNLHVIISAALNWGGLWCKGWLFGGTGQFSLLGNCNTFPCSFVMSFIYQIGNSSVEK